MGKIDTKDMFAAALYGTDLEESHEAGALLSVEDLERAIDAALDDLIDRWGSLVKRRLAFTTMYAVGDTWGVAVLMLDQNRDMITPIIVGPVHVKQDVMVTRLKPLIRLRINQRGLKMKNLNLG